MYTNKKKIDKPQITNSKELEDVSDNSSSTSSGSASGSDGTYNTSLDDGDVDAFSGNTDEVGLRKENSSSTSKDKKLSVEYLEDDFDLIQDADDLDGNHLSPFLLYIMAVTVMHTGYTCDRQFSAKVKS